MIEASNGGPTGSKPKPSSDLEEGEEDEEELEVDSDGWRAILIRFFTDKTHPYYIIPADNLNEKLHDVMKSQDMLEPTQEELKVCLIAQFLHSY